MSGTIKVGDVVTYTTRFGNGHLNEAVVVKMEVTVIPGDKTGRGADEVSMDLVKANHVVFTLDNGRWCYSYQISL